MISKIAVILSPAIVTTLLLLYAPSIYCQDITCSDFCSISVRNDSHVIAQLKNNKKEVLYLLISAVDDSQLFNHTDNTLFALVGVDFGRRFIVMPYDLLLLTVFLSEAFVGTTEVRINQDPDHCYIHLNTSQRDHCTFQALKRLYRLAKSNCTGQSCGTFCKRQIRSFKSLDNIEVTCCPMAHDDEICNVPDHAPTLLVAFRYESMIFSFILAVSILKWLIQEVPSDQR